MANGVGMQGKPIGMQELTKRGLMSPITDIPYDHFVGELRKRGIQVTSEISELS